MNMRYQIYGAAVAVFAFAFLFALSKFIVPIPTPDKSLAIYSATLLLVWVLIYRFAKFIPFNFGDPRAKYVGTFVSDHQGNNKGQIYAILRIGFRGSDNSLTVHGKTVDVAANGCVTGHWKSLAVYCDIDDNSLAYIYRGQNSDVAKDQPMAEYKLFGLARIDFNDSHCQEGTGRFRDDAENSNYVFAKYVRSKNFLEGKNLKDNTREVLGKAVSDYGS